MTTNPLRPSGIDFPELNPVPDGQPSLKDVIVLYRDLDAAQGKHEQVGDYRATLAEVQAAIGGGGGGGAPFVNLINTGFEGTLDYSGDLALIGINYTYNNFTAVSFEGCSNLQQITGLSCQYLTSLNLTGCYAIKSLVISSLLSSFSFTNRPLLNNFQYNDDNSLLIDLDLSFCPTLPHFSGTFPVLENINLEGCSGLTNFSAPVSLLTANLTGCTSLSNLETRNMPLASITGLEDCAAVLFWTAAGNNIVLADWIAFAEAHMPLIQSINFQNFTGISADVSGLPNLNGLFLLGNNGFDTLILGTQASLDELDCSNTGLGSIDISGCPALYTIVLSNTQLPEAVVNSILVDLDTAGLLNGFCNLSGGGSAAPTGAGAAAVTSLQGKGWTVTTN